MELHELASDISCCGICGTPRPKPVEKSLAEKFDEYIENRKLIDEKYQSNLCEGLEKIASDHFSKREV